MSTRIGEVLIEKGFLTQGQLDKALKGQLIFGGHLGTSLIEMGFISEEPLGQTLAELFGVKYASFDLLQNIPPSVIDSIPQKLAERHRVIPIRLEGKTLHLAVIDPKNLGVLDDFSFMTGFKIVPWIAPEIRIFQALEKYYGIPRRRRYITICSELDRKKAGNSGGNQEIEDPTPTSVPESSSVTAPLHDGETHDDETFGELGGEYDYGRSWRDIVGDVVAGETQDDQNQGKEEPHQAGTAQADPVQDLEGVSTLLSRAESKNQLAEAILAFASPLTAHCILFMVKSTSAYIWDSRGLELDPERTANLSFPVTPGSIFELLLGNNHFRGPLPDKARYGWFYSALQMESPSEILLLPIYLNDRLVTIFYVDGGRGSLQGNTEDYTRLTQKLALALNMIIIKKKIRAA